MIIDELFIVRIESLQGVREVTPLPRGLNKPFGLRISLRNGLEVLLLRGHGTLSSPNTFEVLAKRSGKLDYTLTLGSALGHQTEDEAVELVIKLSPMEMNLKII